MTDSEKLYHLDAKGLRCPLPVLRARKMLKSLEVGAHLKVEATDPGAPRDFAAFCETNGYRLISSEQTDSVYNFLIERSV